MVGITKIRSGKKLKIIGKDVIGVDECNNGFQKQGLPLIIVAYLIPDFARSNTGTEPFGKKQGAFARKKHHKEKFIRRAKKFLERNPDFFYTTVRKKEVDTYGFYGRAEAIASVVSRLIESYKIETNNLITLIHRIDQKVHTHAVGEYLEDFLEKASITAPFQFKPRNTAIKRADRVAYFLAGLRRLRPKNRWPCRRQKIDPRYIGEYITQLDQGKYDELEQIRDRT